MADQDTTNVQSIKLQPLVQHGLLDQFNLPPKAIRFIRRHQGAIWLTIATLVLGSLGVSGYDFWREHRQDKGASVLDAALAATQDKRQRLEAVAQEYGATDAGLWAKIELALMAGTEGHPEQTLEQLTAINATVAETSPLKPLLLSKLAALQENQQHLDQALALYTQLTAIEGFAPAAYRALGRLNEQQGKKETAIAMYNKYLELTNAQGQGAMGQGDPVRELVQSRLNQLKN